MLRIHLLTLPALLILSGSAFQRAYAHSEIVAKPLAIRKVTGSKQGLFVHVPAGWHEAPSEARAMQLTFLALPSGKNTYYSSDKAIVAEYLGTGQADPKLALPDLLKSLHQAIPDFKSSTLRAEGPFQLLRLTSDKVAYYRIIALPKDVSKIVPIQSWKTTAVPLFGAKAVTKADLKQAESDLRSFLSQVTFAPIRQKPADSWGGYPLLNPCGIPSAQHELQRLANQKDSDAMLALAFCEFAKHTSKSESSAAHWLMTAAKAGNGDAQYNLGKLIDFRGGSIVNATTASADEWFSKSAKQGNVFALFEKNRNLSQKTSSVSVMKSLAIDGMWEAQLALAQAYSVGIFITQDKDEAMKWYGTYLANKTRHETFNPDPERFLPTMSPYDVKEANSALAADLACDNSDALPIPPKDRPTDQDKKKLAHCDSSALYYGIGRAPDFTLARKCAFIEREQADSGDESNSSGDISGSGVLMMIYANGKGVPRNLKLATRFACEFGGARAELEGRIEDLNSMRKQKSPKDFDVCQDTTSGYFQGVCASLDLELSKSKQQARIKALTSHWSAPVRERFGKLVAAASKFFGAESWWETEDNRGGTARNAIATGVEQDLDKTFYTSIEKVDSGKTAVPSATDFKAADKKLNRTYRDLLSKQDAIAKQSLRSAQRYWIPYRDEWAKFGVARFPTSKADAWKAWLTRSRILDLQSSSDEADDNK